MVADNSVRLVEPVPANVHTKPPRPKPVKLKSKKRRVTILSTISRLATWFFIITILFRCPSSFEQLARDSPKICKPYFNLRDAVAPHVHPYYAKYTVPYVERVRPYYDALERRVITPAVVLGKKYGAPRAAQVQAFGKVQWEKILQPQVEKYHSIIYEEYRQTLGPRVDTAHSAIRPYYDIAKTNALQMYYGKILPTYSTVQPYAVQAYGMATDFVVGTAYPYSKWAWTKGTVFWERTLLPKLRILYGENVEPQLVRIGERLGRYRDGKKIKAVIEEINSSSSAILASETLSSIASSFASVSSAAVPTLSVVETTESTRDMENQIREKANNVVAQDLREWQEKFAKAADEGSDDLEERITEITDRFVQNQAKKVGSSLIIELEETVKSSLKSLKAEIISIVTAAKDGGEYEEAIRAAVRKAGAAIKGKAQAVRTWRQNYDQETNSLVSKAAIDTLEVLDLIQDAGLQEIGMRWAWTDGITHKDWAKYHKLKTKFAEWRWDVEKVVIEHPGLATARLASKEVENEAMGIAEDAANELAKLKDTGLWKLAAKDASDDFSTQRLQAAVAVGDKEIIKVGEIKEAIPPSSLESLKSVAYIASSSIAGVKLSASYTVAAQIENAKTSTTSVSLGVLGSSQESVGSVISTVSAGEASYGKSVSTSVLGTQSTVESLTSVATEVASSIIDKASSSVLGNLQGSVLSMGFAAKETDVSPAKVSSNIGGEPKIVSQATAGIVSAASLVSESASSYLGSDSSSSSFTSNLPSSASSAISSSPSAAFKSIFSGAMAQHVEAREIIFDDYINDVEDTSFSDNIQLLASEAGEKYSDVTNAMSEALKPTKADESSMTKLAPGRYSSALSAASAALYDTEQKAGESVSSIVSSRYAEAISAASAVIYGTPLPTTQSISSQTKDVYKAAQSILLDTDTKFYRTPMPTHQAMFSSLSSVAQSKLSEGLSAASERWESSKSYVAEMKIAESAKQKILDQIKAQFYAGIGMAHAQYDEFMAAASSVVLPREISLYDTAYSKTSQNIIGSQSNAFQAALDTAELNYASATARASSHLDALISVTTVSQADIASRLAVIASRRYSEAVSDASKSLESSKYVISEKRETAVSASSTASIRSDTPYRDLLASQASENWKAIITKVSCQIYGGPTPSYVTRRLLSEVGDYAAQTTDAVGQQYSAIKSLVSELVIGREPDFTESVYKRVSSVYHTGIIQLASSASSYASGVFESATCTVGSIFTNPPQMQSILNSASERINEAVASVQIAASEKIYGSNTGYVQAVQSSISDAVSSAQKVIMKVIYETPTASLESVTSVAGEAYTFATDAASSLIHGQEKGATESARAQLSSVLERARDKLAKNAASSGKGLSDVIKQASKGVENYASSVSSAVASEESHNEL